METRMQEGLLSSQTHESERAADSSRSFSRFRKFFHTALAAALFALPSTGSAQAEEIQSPSQQAKGSLFIVGGGKLSPEITDHYLQLAKGRKAKIVLIPTASEDAEVETSIEHYWKGARKEVFRILHTRDREVANDEAFVKPLQEATAVWISGGRQSLVSEVYKGTRVEKEIQGVLDRDGVVGGSSAGAAIMPGMMIAGGNVIPEEGKGFNFFDGSVDQHFFERNRQLRLMNLIEKHPHLVGMGIDENTAVVVRHSETEENIQVFGKGRVWIYRARLGENRERMKLYVAGDQFTVPRLKADSETLVAKTPPAESEPDATQTGTITVSMPPTP